MESNKAELPGIWRRALMLFFGLVTANVLCGATLTAPSISTQPSDKTINEGQNVTLSVTASGSTPLVYQWFFNDAALAAKTNSSLAIPAAQGNQSGGYFVTASNAGGMVTSRVATLLVVVPPIITKQPVAQTNFQGETVIFSVTATGTAPTYQWKYNGGAISTATNATMLLTNVQGSDAGKYKVEVKNAADTVTSAEVTLSVYVPPTITTQPLDKTLNQGQNVTLSLAASGTAPLAYQWFFNGVRLTNAMTTTLALTAAQGSQSGNYFAVVSNIAAVVTSRVAKVLVVVPPTIFQQPLSQTVGLGGMCTLSVAANGTAPFTYQWKLNGGSVAGATSPTFTITNAHAAVAGTYRVDVSNPAGQVTSSNAVVSLNTNLPPDNTVYWTNALGGAWDDAANWSPNRVPVFPNDNVIITQPGNYTVELGVNVTNATLQLGGSGAQRLALAGMLSLSGSATVTSSAVVDFSSGLLTGNGTLSLSGVMNWTGGRISKDVTVASSGFLNLSGATLKQLAAARLTNSGVMTWSDNGNLEFGSSASLVNENLFEWQNDLGIQQGTGAAATLVNRGTIRKAGSTGTSLVKEVALVNSGTIDAQSGTIVFNSGPTNTFLSGTRLSGSGQFLIDGADVVCVSDVTADSLVTFKSGSWIWKDGSRISGAGNVVMNGGDLLLDGSVALKLPFEMKNGALDSGASGAGVLSGQLTWSGGSIVSNLVVATNGSLILAGNANKKLDGVRLENRGTVIFTGTGDLQAPNNSVINNYGQFVFLNSGLLGGGKTLCAFTNAGVVTAGNAPVEIQTDVFFVQTAPGVLRVGIGGVASNLFDRFISSTNAVLDGTVQVWRRDGFVPSAGDQFTVMTYLKKQGCFAALASADDYFTWKCGGRDVTVSSDLPSFATQPQSQTVDVLSSPALMVAVNASATLQWFFNSATIPGATNAALSLPNILPQQGGQYFVIAANSLGSTISRVATLTVYSPLTITRAPQPLTVNQGGTAVFSVGATSVAPITYRWTFNGATIPGPTNATLMITNATAANTGKYHVVVDNLSDSYTSPEAVLSVNVPPTITSDLVNRTLLVGTAQKFTVSASGTAPFNYTWFFKGTSIPGEMGDTLDLGSAQPNEEGEYFVVISNMAGAVTSRVATLIVDWKPAVITQPRNSTFATGSNAIFAATASGKPAPWYQWKFNGDVIAGATNATLTLPNVQKSHQGKYRVRVGNQYDHDDSVEVTLTVMDVPNITQQPSNAFAVTFSTNNPNANSSAAFTVKAIGDSLTYQWYRLRWGGAPEAIAGANLSSVTLDHVTLADAGLYWVEISNLVGAVVSVAAELKVLGINSQPLSSVTSPGQTIVLNVGAQGEDLHYQWMRNSVFIPGAVQPTHTITNAQPQDGGRYSVLVFNSWGAMRSADAIVRVTSPLLPFSDKFEDRDSITGMGGVGFANNAIATRQAEDPNVNGRRLEDSVWVSWTAPTNGILTLSTLGSDFDTVLAVYSGLKLSELAPIVNDDESAGYHNSRLLFNVFAGVTYQIRVDSYYKDMGGNIAFAWNLLATDCLLPLGITPAGNFVTRPGDPLSLCVTFSNRFNCALNLQWFQDGVLLPGATNACLFIPTMRIDTIGTYSLRLSSADWEFWVAASEVQMNTEGATGLAQNRLDEARSTPLVGVLVDPSKVATGKFGAKVGAPLSSGYSGSQIFRTYSGKDPSEPDACGVEGGASYWFTYSPPETGTLRLSTDGSTFDTVLAIYADDGRSLGYQSLIQLSCDDNSGTNSRTSTLIVPVSGGTNYYIMVDGVNGTSGRINLTYKLDTLPKISAITNQTMQENTTSAPIEFVIRDIETAPDSLALSAACGDTNLVAANGFTFAGNGTNRTVQINPRADRFGTNVVTVRVTDAMGGVRTSQFTLSVVHVPKPLNISGTLPVGLVGAPYTAQLNVSGGAAPYTCSLTSAPPAGLTFNSDGSLTGSPSAAGSNALQVEVVDALGFATNKLFSLVVLPAIRVTPLVSGTNLLFQISGRADKSYILEMADRVDAPTWNPIATNSSASGQISFPTIRPSGPAGFFRTREQ